MENFSPDMDKGTLIVISLLVLGVLGLGVYAFLYSENVENTFNFLKPPREPTYTYNTSQDHGIFNYKPPKKPKPPILVLDKEEKEIVEVYIEEIKVEHAQEKFIDNNVIIGDEIYLESELVLIEDGFIDLNNGTFITNIVEEPKITVSYDKNLTP